MITSPRSHKQQGIALFTALVMLVLVTLLSVSSMRGSILEQRVATNYQQQAVALESAQSAIDAAFDRQNFPVLTPGTKICYNADTVDTDCVTAQQIVMDFPPSAAYSTATNSVIITQTEDSSLSCRSCETSSALFDGAVFNIQSIYDNTVNNGGRAEVNVGFMMLIPDSGSGS